MDFTGHDVEIDAVQDLDVAESDAQVPDFEERRFDFICRLGSAHGGGFFFEWLPRAALRGSDRTTAGTNETP